MEESVANVYVRVSERVCVSSFFSFSFDLAVFLLLSKKSEKQNHILRFSKASSAGSRLFGRSVCRMDWHTSLVMV